ncbi:MAG: hypothetical protein FIB08_15485 [Candidatus Methanoperedens sp.]|nr:hypothetical protein [Candidatus Methanoperedens sp.]
MIIRKLKLSLVIVFAGFVISMMSISAALIAFLIGFTVIPVVFVLVSLFIEGIAVIKKELKGLFDPEKSSFIISISKESITLEPQFG